jgi:hypothetical protein
LFRSIVIGGEKMFLYFFILIIGALLVLFAVYFFIDMYRNKDFSLLSVGRILGAFLIGVLLLAVTLPSLKFVMLKEYDVVKGECVIEVDSSRRSAEANFKMLDTDEIFIFDDIPELDAYGKAVPYYCEVTVTKDRMWEISYKIYDSDSRELILTSE